MRFTKQKSLCPVFAFFCTLFTGSAALAAKPVIFTGNRDYPPLVFLENDKARGIYPDMLQAMQWHGSPPEIRLLEWKTAQAQVLAGEADAVIGMAILDERRKKFDFSDTILAHEFAIFVRRGDMAIRSFQDLKFKTTGIIEGSVPMIQLGSDPEIRFRIIRSYPEGFTLLKEGKVDALVLNEWVSAYTMYRDKVDGIVPVKAASLIGGPAGFAVRKGNKAMLEKINAEIRALKRSGKMEEILERWAPQQMVILPQQKLRNLILLLSAAALFLILLLLALWVSTLRRNLRHARAAEKMLRDSHELLEKLTEQVPGIIFQFQRSVNGVYSVNYISEASRTLQEASPQDIKADFSLLTARLHPEDRERVLQSFAESANNLTLWREEYRMILPVQGVRWRIGESRPERTADGRVLWHGYIADITDRKTTDAQIADLSAKIIELREKEQTEVSRELHDSVGQSLILLKLRLQNKVAHLPKAEQAGFLECFRHIDETVATTREISRRLSPMHLTSLGIEMAVEDIADQIRKAGRFQVKISMQHFAKLVSPETTIQVYRIIQESLTNILKHSTGNEIHISEQIDARSAKLIIADNGTNAPAERMSPGIGLQIMRERARMIGGRLDFRRSDTGTTVTLTLPLPAETWENISAAL